MSGTMIADLFAYDTWANREALRSIREAADPPERVTQLMAHIIGAEWVWLARVQGATSRMAIWPALSADACAVELDALPAAWAAIFGAGETPADDRLITYINTRGERFTNSVAEIAHHVVLHSAYHRGQIATLLRGAGAQPAMTDYIHYARTLR